VAFNDGSALDTEFAVGPADWVYGNTIPGHWDVLDVHGPQTSYTDQTWYQFALTKSNTLYSLYVDGQLSCQQTVAAAASYNTNVASIFGSITPINPSYPYTFLGKLDDFRFYNRALSSNEVQELYAYESVPQGTNQPCVPYPATATASVVNGFVVGATVTDGGCGYTNVPLVSFTGRGGSGGAASGEPAVHDGERSAIWCLVKAKTRQHNSKSP